MTTPLLEIKDLKVRYDRIPVIHGLSLLVESGSAVGLLGSNGAGKSTTMRSIFGQRQITGEILFEGEKISGLDAHQISRRGIAMVPEGRMVFANLTVHENLKMGAYLQRDRKWIAEQTEYVFSLFPRLKERESQSAGTLSGGEQQMLAIGRALLGRPKFLMLDEPSLGIAPLLVKTIFERIVEINREQGLTILLVEQNANLALDISSYAYVLETGKILIEGPSAQVKSDPQVQAAYLGA
jgi:branched-chain amino acid transport system ATP-binding protein